MKVLQHLRDIPTTDGKFPSIGVTIGNFDGVHLGHAELLKKIKSDCDQNQLSFVVITFVPHPHKILQPEKERFLISSYDQRRNILESLGVDYLIEMKFTRDFSTQAPEEFLESFLFCYPELKNFYLGYDFAFGANKQGGFDLVKEICAPRKIHVEIQPKFEFKNEIVSSSLLRGLIQEGKIGEANEFLGRSFRLEGLVVKGEGRGKKIGFPTANIQVSPDIIVPQKGVYVTRTTYKDMTYQSVTNIGQNPTFKDSGQISIETNVFDFDLDIYGESLDIHFLQKIRNEKKFPTVNDLITQIKHDVEFARSFAQVP